MKCKSQIYSELVFKHIQGLVAEQSDDKMIRRYKSLCKRSGGVMRTVGLIQFLTFLAAKATKESEIHHEHLLNHLRLSLDEIGLIRTQNNSDFLSAVRQQSLAEYMRTTNEILKFLQWHRRIAEILIAGTAEED